MGLLTEIFRRSLENPSTPLSAPDDWLFDSLGSFRASSGVNVNRETLLTWDAYWRCVNLISGDAAKLPLCVYQKTDTGKQHATDHDAYRLLRYKSCPELMALMLKRVLTFHGLSEGNGYAYILRDKAGRPLELWPLSPMKTYPVREDSTLWYVTEVNAQQRKIRSENIFHLKGLSFDGLVGYSAVSKIRETGGMALATENFGSIFFRNNARPNVVLKHPGRLKPEAKQNLRESWERMHSGLENAHRTAVLEEGMDIVTLQHNARDAQLLELKGFTRLQVANFFGVPPHKVGDSSRTSYNSLEQENEAYLDDGHGLGYWLAAWEAEAWDKLLSEEEKDSLSHTVEFDRSGLLRANLGARTTYYTAMLTNGVLSPNEVRAQEGLNPRDGGDDYLTPLNLSNGADQGGAGDEDPGPDPGQTPDRAVPLRLIDAHRELLTDALARMAHRLAFHARRAAKKPGEFLGWLDQLDGEHREVIAAALAPAVTAGAVLLDEIRSPAAVTEELLGTFRAELLTLAGATRARELEAAVEAFCTRWEGQTPRQLAGELLLRAVDEPGRSVEDALAILEQIPERRAGTILPPFPVNQQVPYLLTAERLRDLWAADQVVKGKVRLRELIATQDWVIKDVLRQHLKDETTPVDPFNIEGSPDDRPYIVQCQGLLWVYDGHHRLSAKHLRAISKTKAYVVAGDAKGLLRGG